jgi:hypothetical protein
LKSINNQSPYHYGERHVYRLAAGDIQSSNPTEIRVTGFRDSDSSLYGTSASNLYYYAGDQLTSLQDRVVRLDQSGSNLGWSMDLDNDGRMSALSDGLLLAQYVNGLSVDGAPDLITGSAPTRSGEELTRYIAVGADQGVLDVDRDGNPLAASDLLLITRYAWGTYPGDSLFADLPSISFANANRTDIANALEAIF